MTRVCFLMRLHKDYDHDPRFFLMRQHRDYDHEPRLFSGATTEQQQLQQHAQQKRSFSDMKWLPFLITKPSVYVRIETVVS